MCFCLVILRNTHFKWRNCDTFLGTIRLYVLIDIFYYASGILQCMRSLLIKPVTHAARTISHIYITHTNPHLSWRQQQHSPNWLFITIFPTDTCIHTPCLWIKNMIPSDIQKLLNVRKYGSKNQNINIPFTV